MLWQSIVKIENMIFEESIMAYEITRDEFKTLLKNANLDKLDVISSLSEYSTEREWYSKDGELRFSQKETIDTPGVYIVHSELTPEETKEPMPELRIKVESFRELQNILDIYMSLRKDKKDGD